MPQFSVIVPVFEQPEMLRQCLRSIRASAFEDYELLVSDDGSADREAIRGVAQECGARVLRSETRRGGAAARNLAARDSRGDRLAFFDADVTVHKDTLARLAAAFEKDPGLDAVIGSYDTQPTGPGRVSQFRNLMHAHVHHRSKREARTFWTGCGAIDRSRFLSLGGFDEAYEHPSIEDVELGLRLFKGGGRIELDPKIQVTHHKTWTLRSMVHTDLFRRAIPWAALLRDHTLPADLNFRARDRLASVLTAAAVYLAVVAMLHSTLWWGWLGLDLAAIAMLQAPLFVFLARSRGALFAASCFPLLLVYNLVCMAGLAAGFIGAERRSDRWFLPAVAACAALILGLQWAGSAYRAEFDGSPDESAHFVSGLILHDYLVKWPGGDPIVWAEKYYLHYPKVAIGHWPPVFYAIEAFWWLVFPPSRTSVIALQFVLALIAVTVFYRLARSLAPQWMALLLALLLVLAPVTQQGFDLAMADICCLLWSVLLLDATARLAREPSAGSLALTTIWLACALLTKGSAVCLIPAPVIALLISRQWENIPRRWYFGFAAVGLTIGLGWYTFEAVALRHDLLWLGGVSFGMPWPIDLVPSLAGYGFFGLACGGIVAAIWRRRPAAIAAASILLSAAAVSFVLRAMTEARHWIIVLPSLLLLGAEFLMWIQNGRSRLWLAPGIAGIVLFPFVLVRQSPAGFERLRSRIHTPGRMMVSSTTGGEGPWIAAVALGEQRPSSVVVRASKSLASMDWNGNNYHLIVPTLAGVDRELDQLGIDTVVLHTGDETPLRQPPHHLLLHDMLVASDSWRECAQAGGLTAYCRTVSPKQPRKPLRIDLGNSIGRVIEE